MKGSASKVSSTKTTKTSKDVAIGVLDDIDMKDEMRRLKIRLHYLNEIKNELNDNINQANDKVNIIKREHDMLLMKTESAREAALLEEIDDDNNEQQQKIDSTTEKRLNISNKKLEISILNKDIKGALKGLEAMALDYESRVFALQKNADKATNIQQANPFLLSKSDKELDEIYGDMMEQKLKLQSLINNDTILKKKEKDIMTRELSRSKETLVSLLDEREMYDQTVSKTNRILLSEQTRCNLLKSIQRALRQEIGKFHNTRGWEIEAFTRVTGSRDGSMNIIDIPKALKHWISPDIALTLDVVYRILHIPPRDDDDRSIDINSFYRVCDEIMKE